jgi:serine/threonine protein kinase
VLEAGYAVGRALAWLHAQGLCHTDLKPSNVLLTATNGWKLCDFASATKEGALFGEATFHYCAPEQVKLMIHKLPLVASFDADVWAYSKMLYEMAVGSPDALCPTSTSDVLTLEFIAAFKDPVVVEEKLRFAVVRTVLLSSLCVRTPRPSMERIMAKGFWTGAPTSQVGEELDFSSSAGGGASTSEGKLELAVQVDIFNGQLPLGSSLSLPRLPTFITIVFVSTTYRSCWTQRRSTACGCASLLRRSCSPSRRGSKRVS